MSMLHASRLLLAVTLASGPALAHAEDLPLSAAVSSVSLRVEAPNGWRPSLLRELAGRSADPYASLAQLQVPARSVSATEQLRGLRMEGRDSRRTAGIWLFGWGAANAVGGALAAGLQHDDEAWLGAGVTAASFGVVNALLAIPLLDLSGAHAQEIADLQVSDTSELQKLRDEQLVAELESGQFYAVNLGLDVAYITAGVFLYVLGRETSPRLEWAQGAGLTAIGQGAFLFVFDLVSWMNANARAERFRALPGMR